PAYQRIESREQAVLDPRPRPGQQVHERRFAGIRVADEGHARHGRALLAPFFALGLDVAQVGRQTRDPPADEAAVDLELRLAHAPLSDAAVLPRQVGPLP